MAVEPQAMLLLVQQIAGYSVHRLASASDTFRASLLRLNSKIKPRLHHTSCSELNWPERVGPVIASVN